MKNDFLPGTEFLCDGKHETEYMWIKYFTLLCALFPVKVSQLKDRKWK